jgi:hypothetical protein
LYKLLLNIKVPEGHNIGNKVTPSVFLAPELVPTFIGRGVILLIHQEHYPYHTPLGLKVGGFLDELPIFYPSGAFQLIVQVN